MALAHHPTPRISADVLPAAEWGAAVQSDAYFGGARLLVSDARVAALLLNEARCRAVERMFGVQRDDGSLLVTIVALGALAHAVHGATQERFKPPSLSAGLLCGGLLRESVHTVAGDWSRGSPMFGTLIVVALMGAAARSSARGVRSVSHQLRTDFDHRYGHLIRRNHPRRLMQRALARDGAEAASALAG